MSGAVPPPRDKSWDGPFPVAAMFFESLGKTHEGNDVFATPMAGTVSDGSPESYREIFFVMRLAGGRKRGTVTVEIYCRFPDGARVRVTGPDRLLFDGPGSRHNSAPLIRVPTHTEGILWFEVVVDNVVLTRAPFEVQHELVLGP